MAMSKLSKVELLPGPLIFCSFSNKYIDTDLIKWGNVFNPPLISKAML